MIKVCVAIVTYNHEKYITRALDSVLMQKTSFDYEIIVGEDCSTDNTREILIDYKNKYPKKIRLFLNEQNLGMHRNGDQVLKACQGKYIAMLDGDDYWTSPEKLQKQVDFLDSHDDCVACFHDSLIVYEDGSRESTSYRLHQKEISTIEDLLYDNFIPTSAVMFRGGLYDKLPDWVARLKMGDWLIHIMNALHGRVGFLNETMAVYFVHSGGVWSLTSHQFQEKAKLDMYEALALHLGPPYRNTLQRILIRKYVEMAEHYESIDDLENAKMFAGSALKERSLVFIEPLRCTGKSKSVQLLATRLKAVKFAVLFKYYMKLIIIAAVRSHMPPLYRRLKSMAHE